jgi:hypothetical protein
VIWLVEVSSFILQSAGCRLSLKERILLSIIDQVIPFMSNPILSARKPFLYRCERKTLQRKERSFYVNVIVCKL